MHKERNWFDDGRTSAEGHIMSFHFISFFPVLIRVKRIGEGKVRNIYEGISRHEKKVKSHSQPANRLTVLWGEL